MDPTQASGAESTDWTAVAAVVATIIAIIAGVITTKIASANALQVARETIRAGREDRVLERRFDLYVDIMEMAETVQSAITNITPEALDRYDLEAMAEMLARVKVLASKPVGEAFAAWMLTSRELAGAPSDEKAELSQESQEPFARLLDAIRAETKPGATPQD